MYAAEFEVHTFCDLCETPRPLRLIISEIASLMLFHYEKLWQVRNDGSFGI